MKMKWVVTGALAVAAVTLNGAKVEAAQADANALQTVISALAITKTSDLDFGTAVAGDGAKTINADVVDNLENASFSVTGQANYNYVIQLPADGTVVMKKGNGGTPQKEIAVNTFTSFPVGLGTLDVNGNSSLLVGASRGALLTDQEAGDYVGTFTVSVVYP